MRTFPSEHRIWEQAEYQWTNGCFFSALVLLIIQTNQYGCIFLPQHLFSHPKRCMHTALVDFHVPPDFALVCGTQTTSINKRLCCPIANAGSFFCRQKEVTNGICPSDSKKTCFRRVRPEQALHIMILHPLPNAACVARQPDCIRLAIH